jgi:hypothetical protein
VLLCEGLVDLFSNIASQKRRVGVYTPKKFVNRLKKENGVSLVSWTMFKLSAY